MRHGFAFWLICLSLVCTRLAGLHLHACAGAEAGLEHANTHYADNGLLFGDHHSEDDGDDRELELLAIVASKPPADFGSDLLAPAPEAVVLPAVAARLLTLVAARGPPVAPAALPAHFVPPLRGPPSSSLA